MENNQKCAYMCNAKGGCRILSEKVCSHRRCTFFKSIIEYERNKGRDYLYERYLKGEVSQKRYIELCETYPDCIRTKLPTENKTKKKTGNKKGAV